MIVTGQCNVPVELSFVSDTTYPDIFNEVDLGVLITAPNGGQSKVPAFWAGGGVFKARFAAREPGRYSYTTICGAPDDAGLHAAKGEIEIAPYSGTNELYRHGRLRVADSRRTLEHQDGAPFFWLGDTWWMGLSTRLDWPVGFHQLLGDRAEKGFSLVQIVAGPYPDYVPSATWDPGQANEAGWPWEPEWSAINPAYFDLADKKIAEIVEFGLVPCIVGMWGYYLRYMGLERVKKHWRYLLARYAAYPIVICLAGEANMPPYDHMADPEQSAEDRQVQMQGWTEVARYVRDLDPYHNPVSVHPSHPNGRSMLLDDSLLDVDMLQTGHSGYQSLLPTVNAVTNCNEIVPRMPVVNSEVCYEAIMGGNLEDVQRFVFWTSITSGSAGHTYGAQGIWAMNSRNCEFRGSTGSWGGGFWQDVMHLPGSEQVGIGRRFFERYNWQDFQPLDRSALPPGRSNRYGIGIPSKVEIYYVPMGCVQEELQGMQPNPWVDIVDLTLEPGNYRAFYFNPRDASEIDLGNIIVGADGIWHPGRKPSMEDWVLVVEGTE